MTIIKSRKCDAALEHPDLERIVKNTRAMLKRESTYEAAVERYRKILEEL
jgi:hypothetical protein